jgi:hypothetical protein
MADFSVSDVASRVNPPQQISIGDMLNIARGAQAYKQAEQINPLQVQQQRAILQQQEIGAQKATRALEPELAGITAESKKSVLSAEQAGVDLKQHYTNVGRGLFGGFVTDPDFINGNKESMIKKIEGAKDYAKNVLGVPEDVLSNADHIVEMAKQNPKQAYQYIKNGILQSGQNAAQTNLVTPRLESINNTAYSYTPATNEAVVAGTGGQQATPQAQTQQVAPPVVTAENMNKPAHSQPVQLKYPVRQPGQPHAPIIGEAEDQAVGTKYRTSIVDRQSNLTASRRNVEEVINTANELEKSHFPTSGIGGAITRKVLTAAGDPTYVQLSKDLANVQMANIQAMGGSLDTDAGKQLSRMANGDETYPPSVLIKIAHRAQADMTNIDMQATAAQKFANKFGDNNMKSFQQMWSKNADSRIFEGMNIINSNMSPEEKKKQFNSLFGHMTEKQKREYQEKKNNLKKLMDTGSL